MNKLHQIWIGPHKRPDEWMATWRDKNPDMEWTLWQEFKGFRYEDKINKLVNEGRYSIASDIMRVEILYKYGGVYVDADSTALEPIQDAPFIDNFFACWDYTGGVANGTIGCPPEHPIMKDYLERISGVEDYWEFGWRMLTQCLEGKDVTILPTCTFYPTNYNGQKAPEDGKIYAKHIWGSTRGKYETTDLHR